MLLSEFFHCDPGRFPRRGAVIKAETEVALGAAYLRGFRRRAVTINSPEGDLNSFRSLKKFRGAGKRTLTKAYILLPARRARRLSWKETAESFRSPWDRVFDIVEYIVKKICRSVSRFCARSRNRNQEDFSNMTKALASMALAAAAALVVSMSTGAVPAAASNAQNGQMHVTKDCSNYTGAAGSYCTIQTSNVAEIPSGTRVFYDQAYGTPAPNGPSSAGMLDSNVVLYAGVGNWAIGRCTLNVDGNTGLCTFSDGVGPLAGFSGRVNVSYTPTATDPALFSWDGTYNFSPLPGR